MPTSRATAARVVVAALTLAAVLVARPAFADTEPTPATAASEASYVRFDGGGWGHGVGMSQYGAWGMAAQGHDESEILGFYYPGSSVVKAKVTDDVRVLLSDTPAVTFTATGAGRILLDGGQVATFGKGATFTVARQGDAWTISGQPGTYGRVGSQLEVQHARGEPVRVSSTGEHYAHGLLRMLLHPGKSTTRLLVAGLAMDDYLRGLAEMPASWAPEALQAQAIAGRTYAQSRINARRAAGQDFDLYRTVSDQVYHGSSSTGTYDPRWVQAVQDTAGMVVTKDGSLITTFYSSSNGGHTERSGFVFATDLSYLVAKPDPYDSYNNRLHRWSRCYATDDVLTWASSLATTTNGSDTTSTPVSSLIDDLTDVRVAEGTGGASGRIDRAVVELHGSRGVAKVRGKDLRTRINARAQASICPGEISSSWLGKQLPSTKTAITMVNPPPVTTTTVAPPPPPPPPDDAFVALSPRRVLDTRPLGAALGAGERSVVRVTGVDVPRNAKAVVMNVTSTASTTGGHITVFPCGTKTPPSSNLNFAAGQTVANLVIAAIGDDGNVCLETSAASTHLVLDVTGYLPVRADYEPITPARLLDTRSVPGGRVSAGQYRTVAVHGEKIPDSAAAAVLNVTVDDPASSGYVTVWPCAEPRPTASSLNFEPGQTVAQLSVAALSDDGEVCLFSPVSTHLVVDVAGWMPAGSEYHPRSPLRLLDSRSDDGPLRGNTVRKVQVSPGGAREGATAAALTVTVTRPQDHGYVSVFACDAGTPPTSNVNFAAGQTVPNMVISALDRSGALCVYSSVTTDLVVDVAGAFGD